MKNEKIEMPAGNYIVGIGASAGGLEALSEFFENMPENTGFIFVIIQHLSPDHKSLLVDLLAKHTTMKVLEATDGAIMQPNCVYVIPSRHFMTMQWGKLHLKEKLKSKMPNNAIDVFFESLAKEGGTNAVGIVLSGTGTDGSKGLTAIKKAGGIVVVQDPLTAAFDGMPNAALATGTADLIVPPDAIAEELMTYLNESPHIHKFHAQNNEVENSVRDLLGRIKNGTGLDFSYYKRPTLYRRLAKRISELGIARISDYLKYMETHSDELNIISKEFLINVSSFFRNPEAFELIKGIVIPAITKDKEADDTVKIWSVACSTGEEVYSLAILLKEYMEKHKLANINIKIFATDIDRDALDVASRGVYSKSIIPDIPPQYLKKYFTEEGTAYKISADIRRMVVFSYHDILKNPPFSKMDLVSCRNMMIYVNPDKQKEILKKLHFALNLDGYLFLGPSENLGPLHEVTEEIDKKWKIYKIASKQNLQNHDSIFASLETHLPSAFPQQKTKNALQHINELFADAILEERNHAGIYITKDFEVKQAVGNYKNFLDFPETGFNFNLVKLVKPDLGIALGVAIRKAIKENDKVVMKGVKVRDNDNERILTIIVKPHLSQKDYLQPFLFIVLSEEQHGNRTTTSVLSVDHGSDERVAELEKELAETRANLQSVIEEMETSSEELVSTNEEMLSTNEELQSTNEELQSLNEELHTVSAEHQLKIKELTDLNDDLNNYFRNSDIGQLLIDGKLIIRKFTPAISRMINLIDADLNRSILDITTNIKNIDFVKLMRNVISSGDNMEMEVTLANNSTFLMRISPYIKQDNSIDGVVVTFIDISELKKLTNIVQAVFDSSVSAINVKRAVRNAEHKIVDFEYIAANSQQEKLINVAPGTLIGKRMTQMGVSPEHFKRFIQVVETGDMQQYDWYDVQNGAWYDIVLIKMMDGLVTTATSITEKKKATDTIAQNYEDLKAASIRLKESNAQLERSNMDLLQFASVASHDLKEPLRKIETFGNLLHGKMQSRFQPDEILYLDKMIKAAKRMQVLINDVLTLSKLSNEQLPTELVNMNSIMHRIQDDLEITIKDKNAIIEVGELPTIKAVPGQMHQIFQNLIVNALKFSDTNRQPKITIALNDIGRELAHDLEIKPTDYYCISVKDNGIGFDAQFREKIFGIFQRLHGARFEGTGIGLAICKKIVDNHKGFLIADSKENEGAEFMVILPK